jgi:N6-L-threonylcarbamoyladenine synthase
VKILGIESSCDETAAAVVEDGRIVLSSAIASQIETHRSYGGVVPEIASRMHVEAICGVTEEALLQSGLALEEIDAVAVTAAPGLIGALLVGVNYAKGLAFSAGKPLVAVHHLRGHIAANYITHPALAPPFLCLIASGGHTHIVQVRDYTDFHVLGRTRDDAAGEAFDKAARALGLPYPGGVQLDRIGQGGDPRAYRFPRPKLSGGGYDFSFSGLKTAALTQMKTLPAGGLADFAASFQYAVADYLCHNTLLAAREHGYTRVALAGGVCANTTLRREMQTRCAAAGAMLYMPQPAYCGDNAAMIAAQGFYEYKAHGAAGWDLTADARSAGL